VSRSSANGGERAGSVTGALATVDLSASEASASDRCASPAARAAARSGTDDSARRALRRIASGVTVLTVNANGRPHGITVSAVVTISRDPLVLGACLRTSSGFTAMVRRRRLFTVNVLATGQAAVAERFADASRRPGKAQFGGLRWTPDEITGAPVLGDCLARLACQVTGCQQVGDHDMLIAEVLAGSPSSGLPLLSFAGQLKQAAGLAVPRT